jgi:hypothetical protein
MLRHHDPDDDDRCSLSVAELGELLWGPAAYGSLFESREVLEEAWILGRDYLMKHCAGSARRPAAFWELEWQGEPVSYDVERSTLWRMNMLAPAEKIAIEAEWLREFELTYTRGYDPVRRRRHLDWADIPIELRKRWRVQQRRPAKAKELGAEQLAGEASEAPAAPAQPT